MLLVTSVAFAADMEGERLVEEIGKLAEGGRWTGVERAYQALLLEHPQSLRPEHHLLGAEAARLEGDLLSVAQRLMRVPETATDVWPRAEADLDLLRHRCQLVVLDTPGILEVDAMPFSGQLAAGVRFASEKLQEDGVFVGLLPSGRYTIDGRPMRVGAGLALSRVAPASESEADAQ